MGGKVRERDIREGDQAGKGPVGRTCLLYMSETMSISASAAAIFSADEGCGRPPPKRKDISVVMCGRSSRAGIVDAVVDVVGFVDAVRMSEVLG